MRKSQKGKKAGSLSVKIRGQNISVARRNFLIIVGILFLDQLTKYLTRTGDILFDTKHFAFSFVKNTGASFGMFKGFNSSFIWISFIVLGFIIYYYVSINEKDKIPLLMVTSGIVGNLVDRLALGYVTDFIDFKFFPVFNIADSAMVVGVAWIILNSILDKGKK